MPLWDQIRNMLAHFKHDERVDLWDRLTDEGQFKIIDTLHHIEKGTGGFGTIVRPLEGFSEDPETHEDCLQFIEEHGCRILDVDREVLELDQSLHGGVV